ncbi:hypothetical protein FOL46_003168 [Perkinsus olseni]|uniref:Uncharacterized protein n=1 Tax=Perkinsus olseni TaxID=32597 RepID=A0A7J6MUX1_PEROL|nr:hypothetical protein FOL46_003168 [Perkinsus olseni]
MELRGARPTRGRCALKGRKTLQQTCLHSLPSRHCVGKYVCDFYPVSGALTFLANSTFNIDILLRGCKISVNGLHHSKPIFERGTEGVYFLPFSYNHTNLLNVVQACHNEKIKISDFAIPIKFFFIVKYDENSIVTEWGQEEGIFDHEEML